MRLQLRVWKILVPPLTEQRHALVELRVIRNLNLEARREAESFADIIGIILAWMQGDAAQRYRAAKIDLHPLHDVRVLLDRAVIAEGVVLAGGFFERDDFLVEVQQRLTSAGNDFVIDLLFASFERLELVPESRAFSGDGWLRIIFFVRAIDSGENGLKTVVVLHGNRVELVIVALGALDSEAIERLNRVHDHVVTVQVARDFAVDFRLRHLLVANQVPRAGGEEAQGLDAVTSKGKQNISRDLLLHEAPIGLVLVEGANDVITIRPGVRPGLVLVIAVRLTVMDYVEPMPRPALAIVRRSQQGIDQVFITPRIRIADERLDLLRRRRQAEQVEIKAANERSPFGFGGRREALFGQLGENECVDWIGRLRALRGLRLCEPRL